MYEAAVDAYVAAEMQWEDVRDDPLATPPEVRDALEERNSADVLYDAAYREYAEALAAERRLLDEILTGIAGGRVNGEGLPSWASSAAGTSSRSSKAAAAL